MKTKNLAGQPWKSYKGRNIRDSFLSHSFVRFKISTATSLFLLTGVISVNPLVLTDCWNSSRHRKSGTNDNALPSI